MTKSKNVIPKKKPQKNVANFMIYFFFGLWTLVMLLIISVNLNAGFGFSSFIIGFLYVLTVIIVYAYRKKILDFLQRHQKLVILSCVLMIIAGVLLRLGLMFLESRFGIEDALTDTGVHWAGATQLVESGELNEEVGGYEKLFPYLTSYTGVLGLAMKIFGVSYKSVVIINTFYDVLAMVGLFLLFWLWKKNKKAGLIAAAVWAINPLQIIFCSMPMAIVATNTMVILAILLIYLLYKYGNKNLWLGLGLALLCGVSLAVGNIFRPIFVVFLIALIVFELYFVFRKKRRLLYTALECVVAILGYVSISFVWTNIIPSINPYYAKTSNDVGWSFYVGANYEENGKWSSEDSKIFFDEVLPSVGGDVTVAQDEIFSRGGERYFEMMANGRLLNHMFNKSSVLFADVDNSIYDFRYDFHIKDGTKAMLCYRVIQNIILLFYFSLVLVTGYFIYWIYKNKIDKYFDNNRMMLYIIITFVGLFAASMLVEVMNRYSLPFITLLTIIAVNALWDMKKCYNRIQR